jgi:hypothetical protein
MDFRSTYVFSMKKADNSMNFTAVRIINRRTHRNSLYREEQTLGDQLWMVYKAVSHVILPRMCELSPHSYISCLKEEEVTFQIPFIETDTRT